MSACFSREADESATVIIATGRRSSSVGDGLITAKKALCCCWWDGIEGCVESLGSCCDRFYSCCDGFYYSYYYYCYCYYCYCYCYTPIPPPVYNYHSPLLYYYYSYYTHYYCSSHYSSNTPTTPPTHNSATSSAIHSPVNSYRSCTHLYTAHSSDAFTILFFILFLIDLNLIICLDSNFILYGKLIVLGSKLVFVNFTKIIVGLKFCFIYTKKTLLCN